MNVAFSHMFKESEEITKPKRVTMLNPALVLPVVCISFVIIAEILCL